MRYKSELAPRGTYRFTDTQGITAFDAGWNRSAAALPRLLLQQDEVETLAPVNKNPHTD